MGYLQQTRVLYFQLYIGRPDGTTWEDVTGYLSQVTVNLGNVDMVGTSQSGADGQLRHLDFTICNNYANQFYPERQDSAWNIFGGGYNPLVFYNREVIFKAAALAVGVTPVAGDYLTLFHGYIDGWSGSGLPLSVACTSKIKRLQLTYPNAIREYGSSVGAPVEGVIQQQWDDNLGAGVVTLVVIGTPTFVVKPYQLEYKSCWDSAKELVDKFGWFIGDRRNAVTNEMEIVLMEPPRTKATADIDLDYLTDVLVESFDTKDLNICNYVEVSFINASTGAKQTITPAVYPELKDTASIAQFWQRGGQLSEGQTSIIDTPAEAAAFGAALIHDCSYPHGQYRITTPFIPEVDLFTTMSRTNSRISSTTDFFAVESVQHTIDFEGGSFRTETICNSRVIGGRLKWITMLTRPGLKQQVQGKDFNTRSVYPAPSGLVVSSSGTEQAGQSVISFIVLGWTRPPGYYPGYYKLLIQLDGGDWSQRQELVAYEAQQKVMLPGNVAYEAKVACVSVEGREGTFSSVLDFTTPADTIAPDAPTAYVGTLASPGIYLDL